MLRRACERASGQTGASFVASKGIIVHNYVYVAFLRPLLKAFRHVKFPKLKVDRQVA